MQEPELTLEPEPLPELIYDPVPTPPDSPAPETEVVPVEESECDIFAIPEREKRPYAYTPLPGWRMKFSAQAPTPALDPLPPQPRPVSGGEWWD